MKTLRFTYHMELRFSGPVTDHHFTFKCFPSSDEMQKITDLQVDIQPQSWTASGTDSFGNQYLYGANEAAHTRLYIGVSGNAQTGLSAETEEGPASAADASSDECGVFLSYGNLTMPGESVRDLDRRLMDERDTEGEDSLPLYLCHGVYRNMNYVPGATHFGTTAEQACRERKGVCQDYAHILLSLLRMHQVPCRYVAGIMVGTGKSHAWVEAREDGRWVGYDPTNDLKVTDSHISFARGRNCMDTLVNRGVFRGSAVQHMYVTATAVEVGLESYFS